MRMRLAIAAGALLCIAATPPPPPLSAPRSTKIASIYNLAHVGAILEVCAASPAAAADAARAKEIGELSARVAGLAKTMSLYYREPELTTIYDATRKQMAGDDKLQRRVHEAHQDCGERSMGELRAYVAENETMISKFLESRRDAKGATPR